MRSVVLQNTVADFDPQQVVDVVQNQLAPEDWVVSTAQRGRLVIQVVRNGLFALSIGVVCLLVLMLWIFTLTHLEGAPEAIFGMLVVFVAFAVSGLVAIACAIEMWKALRMLTAAQAPWVALTPNGIVEYFGSRMGVRFALAFANTLSMAPLRQKPLRLKWLNPFYQGVGLSFTRRHPLNPNRRLTRPWMISPGYPLPEQLAQLVLLSQRAYRSRTTARSVWAPSFFTEPVDPRKLQIANPTGWSWTLTVGGILFTLMALAWTAFVIWTNFSYPYVPTPWFPYALGGACFVIGVISWLLAWRIGDWKKDL